MNTSTNLEFTNNYEVSQEERESYMMEILQEIIQLFEANNGVLPFFEGELAKDLEEKFSEALNGKFQDGENPLLLTSGKYYIYGDEFTSDEIKEIVIAFTGEEDIDFIISFSRDGFSEDSDDFYILMHLSQFPGNVLGAISDKVRKIINDKRKS